MLIVLQIHFESIYVYDSIQNLSKESFKLEKWSEVIEPLNSILSAIKGRDESVKGWNIVNIQVI